MTSLKPINNPQAIIPALYWWRELEKIAQDELADAEKEIAFFLPLMSKYLTDYRTRKNIVNILETNRAIIDENKKIIPILKKMIAEYTVILTTYRIDFLRGHYYDKKTGEILDIANGQELPENVYVPGKDLFYKI